MHYHLEILMPPTDDVMSAVTTILAPFDENAEHAVHPFWDWWQLGGRYSGSKLEASASPDSISAFRAELHRLGVTVSGLVWGKQELQPASQAEAVDALWREMCPGAGSVCPMFKHSGDSMSMDVCRLDAVPKSLTAFAFIHAAAGFKDELRAQTMLRRDLWNGVTHQSTDWSGNVAEAIGRAVKTCERYKDEYAAKVIPQQDWLVVTVDYHT